MRTNSPKIDSFSMQDTLSRIIRIALSVTCSLSVTSVIPGSAIAGDRPVAQPDSGSSSLSDTFSPHRHLLNKTTVSARISHELAAVLQHIQTSQSVPSVAGQTLSISAEQVSTIISAVATKRARPLEQQLITEMNGLEIEISVLDVSAQNLSSAIDSTNNVVATLNSEQLVLATESPTFMALLQLISATNQAIIVEIESAVVEEKREIAILKMSLR